MSFWLIFSATLAAAAAPLVLSWIRQGLGVAPIGTEAALWIAFGASALDLTNLIAGRPGPPSSKKQVPMVWSRVLPMTTASWLYGLRLGIGPLTILTTWMWYASVLVAGSLPAVQAAAAGAAFGSVRSASIVALSCWAETSMARRMRMVQANRARTQGLFAGTIAVIGILGLVNGSFQ